jgi:hypothetical protein
MKLRICAAALLTTVVYMNSSADAAIWGWGCKSDRAKDPLILNRYSLILLDKPSNIDIADLATNTDELKPQPGTRRFLPNDDNFDGTTQFEEDTDAKTPLVLSQISAKRISSKTRVFARRLETKDIWRKVYRFKLGDEPARNVAMQCMEYNLSTEGGGRY